MSTVRTALYARLAATPALTALVSVPDAIFHQVAPAEADPPFVVFHRQTGTPIWAFQGDPLETGLWLVKAVDLASSASRAEEIAAAIDAALTDAPLVITDRALLYLRREQDVEYPEPAGGQTWHHAGAIYRLITEKT